jgi:hypothetical protein
MTDHPDTITVAKCHPFRGDNFYITLPGSDRSGVEYIRADVSAARIADLERQLAEAREVKPRRTMTNKLIDRDLTQEEWRAVVYSVGGHMYKLGRLYGLWLGLLLGWVAGGLAMMTVQSVLS